MKNFILAIAAAALFTSCKKEKIDTPPVSVEKNYVKYVETSNSGNVYTSNYAYDGQGRITTEDGDSYLDTYTYPTATTINRSSKNKSTGAVASISDFTLDANGRVVKAELKNAAGVLTGTTTYVYDAGGHLQSYTYSMAGSSNVRRYDYTFANGNYTTVKYYLNDVLKQTTVHTHDMTKKVKLYYGVSASFPSRNAFGIPNANPIIETKITNVAGTVTNHTTNTYQVDADGYITHQNYQDMLTGYQSTIVYTYQ